MPLKANKMHIYKSEHTLGGLQKSSERLSLLWHIMFDSSIQVYKCKCTLTIISWSKTLRVTNRALSFEQIRDFQYALPTENDSINWWTMS